MKLLKFTLLELLVVIAIITILASMLLPALGKSREMGKRVLCGSNVKNVGLGITMYTNDWNSYMPVVWDGKTTWSKRIHDEYVTGKTSVFQCPSGNIAKIPLTFSSNSDKTYGIFCSNIGAPYYGMGGWQTYARIAQFSPPSEHVILTDTINLDGTSLQCYVVGYNQPYANSKIQLRHLKTSNVFFIDGHLNSVKFSFWLPRLAFNSNYLVY